MASQLLKGLSTGFGNNRAIFMSGSPSLNSSNSLLPQGFKRGFSLVVLLAGDRASQELVFPFRTSYKQDNAFLRPLNAITDTK
jgi:hypothetical protein